MIEASSLTTMLYQRPKPRTPPDRERYPETPRGAKQAPKETRPCPPGEPVASVCASEGLDGGWRGRREWMGIG